MLAALIKVDYKMSLINCPHCKHKVSEDALTCPHCSKPILVLSDRACEKCGERLPKRKRKCSKCGHTNSNKPKSQNVSNQKSNNKWLVIVVLLVVAAGYLYLNQNNDTTIVDKVTEPVIPEGTYRLIKERKVTSVACNLSSAHFGRTIMVSGKKVYTTVLQEMTYDIFSKEGNAFQIGPATATCLYSNNRLTFLCQGEDIVFEKQ